MIPKTLSASSVLVFEACEARYKAENIDKAQTLSNSAADLGTVCHAVLERWVANKHHDPNAKTKFTVMEAIYVQEYYKLFADDSRYEEGRQLLEDWYNRQDFWERSVVSTESKEFFVLNTSAGPINFTYIMDRLDIRDDGIPEVIDYKTVMRPVQPDELKYKIQARSYAVATQLKYPDAERIWVTFDLLRYDQVGVVFTKEENRETYRHLLEVAERILASDGTKETINLECKFCIRKSICDSLRTHSVQGGLAGIDPETDSAAVFALANERSKAKWQLDALKSLVEQYDGIILEYMESNDVQTVATNDSIVTIKGKQKRVPDQVMITRIVGPEMVARYGKITISDIDKMLKDDELSDDQKLQIKQNVRKVYGSKWIDSQPRSSFDEDE